MAYPGVGEVVKKVNCLKGAIGDIGLREGL